MAWFRLNSGSPTVPSNYTLESGTPTDCIGTNKICAVQATPDGSGQRPQLTAALKDQMIDALHDRTPSTNVQLKG